MSKDSMMIDDEEWVKLSSVTTPENNNGYTYVIVRGEKSGVFAGYLKSREGREVELIEFRRLWYWDGAATISQIAEAGVSKPENCKFPQTVNRGVILDAIEVLDATEKSRKSIQGVAVWKA